MNSYWRNNKPLAADCFDNNHLNPTAILANARDPLERRHRRNRSCFDLILVGGVEQETDEFSLPVGSGLLENARKMGFSRRGGDAAPPRGGRTAVPFQNLGGQPRLRGGQAEVAAQINLLPPAVDIRVTHRDDRDGSPDADPGNIRKPGLGAQRRHRQMEGTGLASGVRAGVWWCQVPSLRISFMTRPR